MRFSQYKFLLFILLCFQHNKVLGIDITYSTGDTLGGNNPILPNSNVIFAGNYAGTAVEMEINASITVNAKSTVQAAIGSPTATIRGNAFGGNDGTIAIINSGTISSPTGQALAVDLSQFVTGITTGPSFSLENTAGATINGNIQMPTPVFNNTTAQISNQGTITGNIVSNTANNATSVTYSSTKGGSLSGIFTIPLNGQASYSLDNAQHTGNITSNASSCITTINLTNGAKLSGNIILTNNNETLVYNLNNATHSGSVTASSGALGNTTFNFITNAGNTNNVTGMITGPQNAAATTAFNFNGGTTNVAYDVTSNSTVITSSIGASLGTKVNLNKNFNAGNLTINNGSTLIVGETLSLTTLSLLNNAKISAKNVTASGAMSMNGSLYVSGTDDMAIASLTMQRGILNINVASFTSNDLTINAGIATIGSTPTINGNLNINGGQTTFNGNTIVRDNLNLANGQVTFNNLVTVQNGGNGTQLLNTSINFKNNLTIGFNAASNITIGSQGVVTLEGNLNAIGQDITNSGSLAFTGENLTLTANNYIVNNGTHIINFQGANNPGILNIVGNADFSNGKIFAQINNSGDLLNNSYAIISATGALVPPNAQGLTFPPNVRALIPSCTILGNNLMLTGTRNQALTFETNEINKLWQAFNTINGLQATNNDLRQAITEMVSMIDNNSPTSAEQKLTQLLPQTSATQIQHFASRAILSTLSTHVAQEREIKHYQASDTRALTSFWIRPVVAYNNKLATKEYMGYEGTTAGLLLGLDASFNSNISLGVGVGYSGSISSEKVNHKSKNKIYSLQFAPYLNINLGKEAKHGYLDLFYNYSYHTVHSARMVNMNRYATAYGAKYTLSQNTFKVMYSKSIFLNQEFSLIPRTSILYSHSPEVIYTETGQSLTLTTINKAKNTYELSLGCSVIHRPAQFIESDTRIELRALGLWNVGNNDLVSIGQFALGGNTFTTQIKSDKFGGQVGLGLITTLTNNMNLELSYDFRLYRTYYEHTGFLQLKYLF